MNVLVIGSGGREHALVWKIKQSPKVKQVFCAPGNGGTDQDAQSVDIDGSNIPDLLKFAQDKNIDLTVVGPEAPLVDGLVDAFEDAGLKVFGPRKAAAQLEGSKVYAKEFMHHMNIPTAVYKIFDDPDKADAFLGNVQYPVVVKADGLAAGKGVLICQNEEEAKDAVDQIMRKKIFKEAGDLIVIEEGLEGPEASILVISDGQNYVTFESSQDHKRIFDEDKGPNTGGMGAYSPAPVVTPALMKVIEARVVEPTIRGMLSEDNPFKGVLYVGLMLTAEGPKVLEYNVRLGDPETQAVLPRLKTDLMDVLLAACDGVLDLVKLEWDPRTAICVVMSSGGYPGSYEKGKEIKGLDKVDSKDTVVFHAGTKKDGDKIVTNGGRVLGVVSFGDTVESAIDSVYKQVEQISFDKCFFRRDIGAKALKKVKV